MYYSLLFLTLFLLDAEFVQTLLADNESAWQRLGDDTIPPEQNLEILAELTHRLNQWVPRSFLKENVTDSLPFQRGGVVRLKGDVFSVTKYDGKISLYCCKMTLKDGTVANVFTPSVPQAWKQNVLIQERTGTFGVYFKTYNGVPVFVAPAIEWYPDTWLGNLGFDVASFDQVPVSRIVDEELAKHDEETNHLMFKFTKSDREPFYGLLRDISEMPAGWLEEEAKKQHTETPFGEVDLFNRPHETRGKPIVLHGTAKRVISTPVTDSEAKALFGIDHYYQIYLFTEQSQGNPIVVCVRSLPEGMSTGDSDDFLEQITVAAVPYKLWIYETLTGPHYAPVLVGNTPVRHPLPARYHLSSKSMQTFSFTLFFTLVLFWFACRFWARRSAAICTSVQRSTDSPYCRLEV